MTTLDLDHLPTFRELFALRLSKRMTAQRAPRRPNVAGQAVEKNALPLAWLYAVVRVVLHLVGFAALTFAGFQWNTAAGLVVAGLSCFAMSTLLTRRTDDNG